MKKLFILPLLVLLSAGCGALPVANGPATMAPAANAASGQSVVADSLMGGNKSVAIMIAPPKESGFKVQTVQHHWTADDIYQYTANLKVWNGTAYVDFATPINVVIPQKGSAPKTSAVFTNLKQGTKYQVKLTAQGDDGGTAATATLNANTDTTSVFDFTATQDVEDTLSATMTIVFDQVAFSGTGTATVGTPSDGTYENPSAAETGTAQ
jgi:hypothetical protein